METILFKMRYVIVLSCLFLIFYACSDENTGEVPLESESPYERMGRLHNEGLDYVLEMILSTTPSTRGGGRVIPSLADIRQMCTDFARSKGFEAATKATELNSDTIQDFSFLSFLQQDWLIRIKEVVWTVTPDQVEKFIAGIVTLEESLSQDKEMSEKEKEILFYTMAVCRHSALYWAENFEKWQLELYGIDKISPMKIQTRSEGKYVSKEWWERYKIIVWGDGVGGIKCGDKYYLEDANNASVFKYLEK